MEIKKILKIGLIVLGCLAVFQMFFRYDIDNNYTDRTIFVMDRLTGKTHLFLLLQQPSYFPYPHATVPWETVSKAMGK